jgi:hypothetical protein
VTDSPWAPHPGQTTPWRHSGRPGTSCTFTVPTTDPPRLTKGKVLLVYQKRNPRWLSFLTVNVSIRVADDSRAKLLVEAREESWLGDYTHASGSHAWRVWAPSHSGQASRTYNFRWKLGDQCYGVGWYGVWVRVRDQEYQWSTTVSKKWYTSG